MSKFNEVDMVFITSPEKAYESLANFDLLMEKIHEEIEEIFGWLDFLKNRENNKEYYKKVIDEIVKRERRVEDFKDFLESYLIELDKVELFFKLQCCDEPRYTPSFIRLGKLSSSKKDNP